MDQRQFWDAMHAVALEPLEEISRAVAVRLVEVSGWMCPRVALDMTNFATFIDTGTRRHRSPSVGKAKQKRSDLRIVAWRLVVTLDGGGSR